MTSKAKPRTTRIPKPAPNAFRSIASPSPAQISEKLKPFLQPPMTPEQAEAVFAKNGVPPAKPIEPDEPVETWRQAAVGLGAVTWRTARRGIELFGAALIAVAAPLLTAAVDGLGILVAAITVYELWRPTEALADAMLVGWWR